MHICNECMFTQDFDDILAVAFQPPDLAVYDSSSIRDIACATATGEIRVLNAQIGIPLYTLRGHTDWVWSIDFSPQGDRLASGGSDRQVRLWDVLTQSSRILEGHQSWVRAVEFNHDGTLLARGGEDEMIYLWDVEAAWRGVRPAPLAKLKGHTNWIRSLTFHPTKNMLASASEDGTLRLWHVPEHWSRGRRSPQPFSIEASPLWSVAFNRTGTLLAAAGNDGALIFGKRRKNTDWCIRNRVPTRAEFGHWRLARQHDLLASAGEDGWVRIWDCERKEKVAEFLLQTNWVRSLAFSTDGRKLACGGEDQTIRFWEIEITPQWNDLPGHRSNAVERLCRSCLCGGFRQ